MRTPHNSVFNSIVIVLTLILLLLYWVFPSPTKNALLYPIYVHDNTIGRVLIAPPTAKGDTLVIVASPTAQKGDCIIVSNICTGRIITILGETAEIALFSSPFISETFSVDTLVGESEGLGSGTFRILVPPMSPEEQEKILGKDVIHQKTGDIVGKVASVQKITEKTPGVFLLVTLSINIFDISKVGARSTTEPTND